MTQRIQSDLHFVREPPDSGGFFVLGITVANRRFP